MEGLLTGTFVAAAAVALVAGTVRGFAGFGAAMIMTPALSALYGPGTGIALCLLLEIAVALPLLPRALPLVEWRRIVVLGGAAALLAPAGTWALTRIDPAPMRWLVSAIVLLAVALLASGWRFRGRPSTGATIVAGASSGFLNGLSGMAGPPIAFYYLAGQDEAARVRANLTTYFVVVDLAALASFGANGLLSTDLGLHGLALAPAVVVGGLLGERLFPLASEAFYRCLALILLTAVAIGALIV